MKCLYCDKNINQYSLYDLFIEEDLLCLDCRSKMPVKIKRFKLNDLEVEYFYEYDSLFKSILIQYKEAYDEILSKVFLYRIDLYIKLKYWDYSILYVPSSQRKMDERGFNHLKLIFEHLGLKEVKGLKTRKEMIQEGKDINERRQIIENYYYEGEKLDKVLIVDDVCTTGSTLQGVYQALSNNSRVIKALVLAKA